MKYFTIEELCKTSTGLDNTPTTSVKENLEYLVNNILDPLRVAYDAPITVNSGYRSPAVNKAVKGASTSQHMKGEAADITVGSKQGNKKLYDWMLANCEFDQLINEYDYSWVHVSVKKNGGNRKQCLKIG